MACDGHIEDEPGSFVLREEFQDKVVGGRIRDHVAEHLGVCEAFDTVEFVESKLLVYAVAAPVFAFGGMDGACFVAEGRQIASHVVRAFEVVEHIRIYACA